MSYNWFVKKLQRGYIIMKKGKSLLVKLLLTSMVFTLFHASLLQSTASAAAAGSEVTITAAQETDKETNNFENLKPDKDGPSNLPPRPGSKESFWAWVGGIFAVFVGVQTAQTLTQNAINNGIDATCKKFKHIKGVPAACKVFQN